MKRPLIAACVLAFACQAPIVLGNVETASDAAVALAIAPAIVHAVTRKPLDVRHAVQVRASRSGWAGRQWRCLDAILTAESHYRLRAKNGAHVGIFQHATTPVGASLATQWRLGAKYIVHRYGTPCAALHFRLQKGWY